MKSVIGKYGGLRALQACHYARPSAERIGSCDLARTIASVISIQGREATCSVLHLRSAR